MAKKTDENYYSEFGLKPLVITVERSPDKYINFLNAAMNTDSPKANNAASPQQKTLAKRKHNKINVYKPVSVFKRRRKKKQEKNEYIEPTAKEPRQKKQASPRPLRAADPDIPSSLLSSARNTCGPLSSKSSNKTPIQNCQMCQQIVDSIIVSSNKSLKNPSRPIQTSDELLSCPFTCSFRYMTLQSLKVHIIGSHLVCGCRPDSQRSTASNCDENSATGYCRCPHCSQTNETHDDLEEFFPAIHNPLIHSQQTAQSKTMSSNFLARRLKKCQGKGPASSVRSFDEFPQESCSTVKSEEINNNKNNNDVDNSDSAIDNFLGQIKNNQDEIYKDYEFLETVQENQISNAPSSLQTVQQNVIVESVDDPYEYPSDSPELGKNRRKRKLTAKPPLKTTVKKRRTELEDLACIKVIKGDTKSAKKPEKSVDSNYGLSNKSFSIKKQGNASSKKKIYLKKTSGKKSEAYCQQLFQDCDNLLKILQDPPEFPEEFEKSEKNLEICGKEKKSEENTNFQSEDNSNEMPTLIDESQLSEDPKKSFINENPRNSPPTLINIEINKENLDVSPETKPDEIPTENKQGYIGGCKGLLQTLLDDSSRPKISQYLQKNLRKIANVSKNIKKATNSRKNQNVPPAVTLTENREVLMEILADLEDSPQADKNDNAKEEMKKIKVPKINRKLEKTPATVKNSKESKKNEEKAEEMAEKAEEQKEDEPILHSDAADSAAATAASTIDNSEGNNEKMVSMSCPQCKCSFQSLKDLAKHFYLIQPFVKTSEESMKDAPFSRQCSSCKTSFRTLQLLYCHRYLVHGDESMIHICENCCKILTTIDLVNEHQCADVKTFYCRRCCRNYRSSRLLHNHNKKIHYEHEGQHDCTKCPKKFLTESMRLRHSLKCRGSLNKCDVCNVYWKSEADLVHHVETIHHDKTGIFFAIQPTPPVIDPSIVLNADKLNDDIRTIIGECSGNGQDGEEDSIVEEIPVAVLYEPENGESIEATIAENDTQVSQELQTEEKANEINTDVEHHSQSGEGSSRLEMSDKLSVPSVVNIEQVSDYEIMRKLETSPVQYVESLEAAIRSREQAILLELNNQQQLNDEKIRSRSIHQINPVEELAAEIEIAQDCTEPAILNNQHVSELKDTEKNEKILNQLPDANSKNSQMSSEHLESSRRQQLAIENDSSESSEDDEEIMGILRAENQQTSPTSEDYETNPMSSSTDENHSNQEGQCSQHTDEHSELREEVQKDLEHSESTSDGTSTDSTSHSRSKEPTLLINPMYRLRRKGKLKSSKKNPQNLQPAAELCVESVEEDKDTSEATNNENQRFPEETEPIDMSGQESFGIGIDTDALLIRAIHHQEQCYFQNLEEGIKILETNQVFCPECTGIVNNSDLPRHFVQNHDDYCILCRVPFDHPSAALLHKTIVHGTIDEYLREVFEKKNEILMRIGGEVKVPPNCDNPQD